MAAFLNFEFHSIDREVVDAWLPELQDFFLSKGLVAGLDFGFQTASLGDPLPRRSRGTSDEPSKKQYNMIEWKLGELKRLIQQARTIEDFDKIDINFARDVVDVATVELNDDRSGAEPMNKRRMHDLIDAVLEALYDMEQALSD